MTHIQWQYWLLQNNISLIQKKHQLIVEFYYLHPYVLSKTVTHSHHNEVAASVGDMRKSLYCALVWWYKTHCVFVVLNFPFIGRMLSIPKLHRAVGLSRGKLYALLLLLLSLQAQHLIWLMTAAADSRRWQQRTNTLGRQKNARISVESEDHSCKQPLNGSVTLPGSLTKHSSVNNSRDACWRPASAGHWLGFYRRPDRLRWFRGDTGFYLYPEGSLGRGSENMVDIDKNPSEWRSRGLGDNMSCSCMSGLSRGTLIIGMSLIEAQS